MPPRQNMTHMVVYLNGCRYRVEAYPDWTVGRLKQALWNGGIQRANRPAEVAATPGLQRWEDLAVAYAHQVMADDKKLSDYHVPPGCQVLIGVEAAKLYGKQLFDKDAAYWN